VPAAAAPRGSLWPLPVPRMQVRALFKPPHRLHPSPQYYAHPLAVQVLLMTVGTRGDVVPFVALGRRLRRDGHRVRLGTPPEPSSTSLPVLRWV